MKIICVGRNYVEHAKELNNPLPSEPILFMKPSTALLIESKPFYYPEFSQDIHYELELVLKISKNGKAIDEKFAYKYFDQIGLGIDFTARDLQEKCKSKGLPWEIAKSFDNSAVVGQFVSFDHLHTSSIEFRLDKNGATVQRGNSENMIFTFSQLISYISNFFTLQIGDLIFTGTPAGVGSISIGDRYSGFIGNKELIQCTIK